MTVVLIIMQITEIGRKILSQKFHRVEIRVTLKLDSKLDSMTMNSSHS